MISFVLSWHWHGIMVFSTVNVEEWLASAQAESLRAEEEAESLRSSQGSVFTDGSIVSNLDYIITHESEKMIW